jgi:hypothetical protein
MPVSCLDRLPNMKGKFTLFHEPIIQPTARPMEVCLRFRNVEIETRN